MNAGFFDESIKIWNWLEKSRSLNYINVNFPKPQHLNYKSLAKLNVLKSNCIDCPRIESKHSSA